MNHECILCGFEGAVKFRGRWVCPYCFNVITPFGAKPIGEVLVNRKMRRAFR